MTRRYVRLPPTAELLERLRTSTTKDLALELGCSESAIHRRVQDHPEYAAMRPHRTGRATPSMTTLLARLIVLEGRLEQTEDLLLDARQRIDELERRPGGGVRLVEFRPDHRRIADGGTPVRQQRREAKRRALAG